MSVSSHSQTNWKQQFQDWFENGYINFRLHHQGMSPAAAKKAYEAEMYGMIMMYANIWLGINPAQDDMVYYAKKEQYINKLQQDIQNINNDLNDIAGRHMGGDGKLNADDKAYMKTKLEDMRKQVLDFEKTKSKMAAFLIKYGEDPSKDATYKSFNNWVEKRFGKDSVFGFGSSEGGHNGDLARYLLDGNNSPDAERNALNVIFDAWAKQYNYAHNTNVRSASGNTGVGKADIFTQTTAEIKSDMAQLTGQGTICQTYISFNTNNIGTLSSNLKQVNQTLTEANRTAVQNMRKQSG